VASNVTYASMLIQGYKRTNICKNQIDKCEEYDSTSVERQQANYINNRHFYLFFDIRVAVAV